MLCERDLGFALQQQQLARLSKTQHLVQSNGGIVVRYHLQQELLVALGGEHRYHPIEHCPADAASTVFGKDRRSGIVNGALAFPRPKAVERKPDRTLVVKASGGPVQIYVVERDVILELTFGQLELDDVIGETGHERFMYYAELVGAEQPVFKGGVFVCRKHLLKFGALGCLAKSITKIEQSRRKMQVLLADEYGFCFGVERAVDMVEDALGEGETVRSLGPLIHNEQEMARLGSQGVTTISDPVQIKRGETAVIRAHGVTPEIQRELEEKASKVVDATCPFVTRVQKLAARAAEQDRHVIIVGSPDHPEMIGVKGYAPNHAFVIRDESEVAALPQLRNPLVVSQTTIKAKTFFDTAEAIKTKTDDEVQVVNTICSATRDRQDAARALAGMVDAFYIIGGRHSSNSVKLLAVCKEQCEKSFLIETEDEIDPDDISGANRVGVTAGASTPEWLIQKIVKHLETLGRQNELALK